MQYIMGKISPKKDAQVSDASADVKVTAGAPATRIIPPFDMRPDTLAEGATYNPIPQNIAPMWEDKIDLDMIIVVSLTGNVQPIESVPDENIVLNEKAFGFGKGDKRSIDAEFDVPASVANNGTLFGHFYVGKTGAQLDPLQKDFDPTTAYHFVRPLTQYIAKKPVKKTKNLLASGDVEEVEEVDGKAGPIIKSYYHPNFTMSFVPETGTIFWPTMHPAARQFTYLDATGSRDATGQNGWYYPVLFVNTFWQLKAHMQEMNSTVTRLPIHIDLNNQANWLYNIIASIDEGQKQTARNAALGGPLPPGGGDGSEFEMIKEVLLDTNTYLLITTIVVSILHMIFEMLAFKSDISHWKNKKDNVGISVRSILGNVFMQTVIFLYLLDNNENTSWMIMMSQGMGILLEFWKITKTVDVRLRPSSNIFGIRIAFEDKHKLSETEEKTKEYDAVAFKYVYIAAVPLLFAYAGYSLVYETHKSWYSFIIATLVGSVYAYGFLMMVPSLYINYRLKSVAHLPAKAMTYKFLNTFIDDLFAFTIKMPTLHRLATLRDDLIFFVYLYQSYKYKVDYTRVNEFGMGGEEEELEEKIANKPLKSIADADATVADRIVESEEKTEETLKAAQATKASGSEKKRASRRKA